MADSRKHASEKAIFKKTTAVVAVTATFGLFDIFGAKTFLFQCNIKFYNVFILINIEYARRKMN